MHTQTLLVSALATLAAALPSTHQTKRQAVLASWPATGFREGCSPGGCIASFNISAPAGYLGDAPGFSVTCHPIYIQQGWLECDPIAGTTTTPNSRVESLWPDASQRELIKISVAHIWSAGEGATVTNSSGSVEITAGTTEFVLPVTGSTTQEA